MAVANFHDLTTLQEMQTKFTEAMTLLNKLQTQSSPAQMRYEAIRSHVQAAAENVANQVYDIENSFEERK